MARIRFWSEVGDLASESSNQLPSISRCSASIMVRMPALMPRESTRLSFMKMSMRDQSRPM